MSNTQFSSEYINVEVVNGGFILDFSNNASQNDDNFHNVNRREVFVSQRKLMNRIKELIEKYSLVPEEKE